ncbi:zinc finger protein 862-like [Ptychodera flava]|uniref:zinc finger protein 862-like n=1 Tax=Ptychodera flava TaxID=63121 RepID=UPI00396A2F7B
MAAPERAAKRQRTLLSFGVCPKSHPRVAVSTEQGCSEAAATGGLTDSTQVQPASSTTSTASADAADLTPVQHDPKDSIAHVIKTELHKAVCNSITYRYSLITDESTDITVSKKLVIYCRLLNSAFLPETHFLSNIKVEDGTAAVITQELIKVLEGIGAQPSRLTGFGSYGASVMTGRKSGVAARLKSSVNEKLISIHCLAHKLALCSSQAAKQVEYINNYQETITGIFYFFKRSAVRVSKIEKIQLLLDEPSLRYKEVHAVHWLSFYKALETVYRTWDSLVTFFGQDKDPKSKGFAKKLTEYEFVATTHLMMDAMAAVTEVSLYSDCRGYSQTSVQPSEHTYLGSLQKELQEKDGRVLYKGHALTAGSQKLKHFANVKKQFLEVLVDNICARFPQESKDLVHAFSVLGMRPLSFLNSEELSCWGNEQIDQLVDHYGCTKHDDPCCGDCEDQCNDDVNIVNAKNIRSEWNQIKQLVLSQQYPRDSFAKLWSIIYTYHRDMFPNLIKIAAIALTLPVHSADCERGFSVQNNIKTYDRNRLGAERLNTLATIMVEGPDMEKFDFVSTLSFWKTQKSHRIFKKTD